MYDENSIFSLDIIINLIDDFYKHFFIKNPKLLEFLKKIDKTYYFVLDKRNIDYEDGLNRIACIKKDYPNSPFNKIKELKQANLSMEVFAYLDPIIAISINNTNNNILISSQKLAIKQRSNGNIEIFFIDKRYYESIALNNDGSIFSIVRQKKYLLNSFYKIIKRINTPYEELILAYLKIFYDSNLLKEILKDYNNLPLIDISIVKMLKCSTKQALIESLIKSRVPFNLNRLHFIVGYSFAYYILYYFFNTNLINKKDYCKLYENALYISSLIQDENYITTFEKNNKIIDILQIYYLCRFYNLTDISDEYISSTYSQQSITIKDYIEMSKSNGVQINLNIKSFKRLTKEHNKLVERFIRSKYNEPNTPLKIHRKFNKLSLDSDYKRIEDTYSLYLEGEIQNHCVYSYRNKIDSGKCVIYTTDYENKKYTIEITKNNRNFVLEQIRGKYNSDAPLELKTLINQKLNNK